MEWLYVLVITGLTVSTLPLIAIALVRVFVTGTARMCRSKASLKGKTVIVTGANSGIGLEAAKDFARRGARVIMACRSRQRAAPAVQEVKADCGHENVEFEELDLANYQSIFSFVGRIQRKETHVDLLLNNAGLNLGKKKTSQGVDMTFAVNHLGPFLLTNLLLDLLKASAPARIVNVSSMMHGMGHAASGMSFEQVGGLYKYLQGYDISKLANILHANELARRLQGTGVTATSLHPGAVSTGIWDTMEQKFSPLICSVVRFFVRYAALSPQEGAQTSIFCSVDESLEGVSGKYFDNCREVAPAKHALDEALALKLWDVSAELTGLAKPE